MLVNFNELKRLSSIKNDIKQGNRSKKVIDLDTHHEMEKLYKPVIDPLQEIAKDQKAISRAIELGPSIQPLSDSVGIEAEQIPLAIEDSKYETLRLGYLADRYLKIPSIQYDHAYGIKPVEGSMNFRLGRMDVKIEDNDFIIDEEKYKGTEGVWKLLTLKNPGRASSDDLETYEKMMTKTKAFLLEGQDRVKCNRGNKYKNIIKPIADKWKESTNYSSPRTTPNTSRSGQIHSGSNVSSRSGQIHSGSNVSSRSGQIHSGSNVSSLRSSSRPVSRSRTDNFSGSPSTSNPSGFGMTKPRKVQSVLPPLPIFLPSDPDELVDRHRVLFGAYQAGNTGVFNELQAINDKLLELGIFDLEIIENFSIL